MRLRGVLQPIMAVLYLVGAGSFGPLPVFASQEVAPANTTGKSTRAGPAVASRALRQSAVRRADRVHCWPPVSR